MLRRENVIVYRVLAVTLWMLALSMLFYGYARASMYRAIANLMESDAASRDAVFAMTGWSIAAVASVVAGIVVWRSTRRK